MESANLGHLHQLQEQVGGGSSSLAVPSINGVGSNNSWNQNLLLNGCNYNSNFNGVLSNARDLRNNNDILVHPSLNTSMLQDLGFQWASSAENYSNHPTNDLQLSKIKEELTDSFPKFGEHSTLEDIHSPSTSYIKQEQQFLRDLNEKLLLRNFSSGCQVNGGFQTSSGDFYSNPQSITSFGTLATASVRGNYSRILPTANISSVNPPLSPFPTSLGMNLQALDLLASTKAGVNFSQPLLNNLGSFKGLPFGLDHLQESSQGPSTNCHKISFMDGAAETKRGLGISEPKASQTQPKKPRFESRSLPPFKVRKEKLGDRIAALQQLVAPFGKTDTASVLLEAIGYIKFLQDQVETLSVPYMKNNACRMAQSGSSDEEQKEEPRDLRSRGLCLVPLSCTSYVTNDNGSVWSPPNYSGGT
ncbi:transcription factor bHLH110-like protein isoform X1 [Cinnamomum micranthum f. kanehirae]|uniref:Transcription factor bHLH110-like protein isoform X1 n=1 Tax=Cinnamomum micranthum f. kanehirae TaxID=337451 RepID=A0A3S3MZE5_9MAGN|nr:transcription factor bHLH110-like protein isoform X1 [Cinnamomum micranthum f. kanehirae]